MAKTYRELQEEARQNAIEWQQEFSNTSKFASEVMEAQNHFEKLGKRYGLVKEFRENGII